MYAENDEVLKQCKERVRDRKRIAFTWNQVVSEIEMALGKEDGAAYLKEMEELLNDPYFERDPVPVTCFEIAERRMKKKNPKVLGHVWASPHPEKLGYFHIWTPEGKVFEVFGERNVAQHLIENRIKRAKL